VNIPAVPVRGTVPVENDDQNPQRLLSSLGQLQPSQTRNRITNPVGETKMSRDSIPSAIIRNQRPDPTHPRMKIKNPAINSVKKMETKITDKIYHESRRRQNRSQDLCRLRASASSVSIRTFCPEWSPSRLDPEMWAARQSSILLFPFAPLRLCVRSSLSAMPLAHRSCLEVRD